MLKVENVTKYYGDFKAVDNLSFTVKPGEIFGLLGVNGAGKTTTFRMIIGLIEATNGSITLDNKKIDYSVTDDIGFLTEERSLLTKMTVEEQCIFYGTLKGMKEEEIIIQALTEVEACRRRPGMYCGDTSDETAGSSILLREIIEQEGLDGFLEAEEEANISIAEQCEKSVVATGGSVVYCKVDCFDRESLCSGLTRQPEFRSPGERKGRSDGKQFQAMAADCTGSCPALPDPDGLFCLSEFHPQEDTGKQRQLSCGCSHPDSKAH